MTMNEKARMLEALTIQLEALDLSVEDLVSYSQSPEGVASITLSDFYTQRVLPAIKKGSRQTWASPARGLLGGFPDLCSCFCEACMAHYKGDSSWTPCSCVTSGECGCSSGDLSRGAVVTASCLEHCDGLGTRPLADLKLADLEALARRGMVNYGTLSATIEGAMKPAPTDPGETRGMTTEELRAMLSCCHHDQQPARGARDRALLTLLASTGGRRSEIARVEIPDLDLVRRSLDLATKGGRFRQAVLHEVTVEHLLAWARHHRVARGPLFVPIAKDQTIVLGQALSAQSVYNVVTARRDEAGLDPSITPHSFRRWFVTSLLEADIDLFTVMRAVGHKRPSTTQRYDKRGDDVVKAAVARLELPSLADLETEAED